MATYIKSTCTECGSSPCGECGACGTIQQALGVDSSVTQIGVQVNDNEIGLMELRGCMGDSVRNCCGNIEIVSAPTVDGVCGILVGWINTTNCEGLAFFAGPIGLPFIAEVPICCYEWPDGQECLPSGFVKITLLAEPPPEGEY
jgi:hypothetical protein